MINWALTFDDRNPLSVRSRESICSLGNGYFVTRGAGAERPADGSNRPGAYLAGGYDRLPCEVDGRMIENEDLVNWPNWLALSFRSAGGGWLDTATWTMLEQRYTLDLQRGVLVRRLRVRDPDGRVTAMRSRRLVHMERAHLAAIEWEITPENWSGPIIVRSALDATVANAANAASEGHTGSAVRHLIPLVAEHEGDGVIRMLVETAQSHLRMAQAARTLIFADGRELNVERHAVELSGYVGDELRFNNGPGRTVRVEKTVAIFTSRDNAVTEPLTEAGDLARRAPHFSELLRTHSLAWKRLWHRCDIVISPTDETAVTTTGVSPADASDRRADAPTVQALLRLQLFHILQTVSAHTVELDAGVPTHGWHGESTRGHVSWDELFALPLLTMRVPEIGRALLMYRFRRLGAARLLAASDGARGARFPWRSGSNGRDESPRQRIDPLTGHWRPDHTRLQAHIGSAVALDVWRYYQATGDHEFLSFYGAEIVLEIARYWASRAVLDDADARYHIRGVVGPDEHQDHYPGSDAGGVDDNSYTNVMAAWTLRCAGHVLDLLPPDRRDELCDQLELTGDERELWRDVSQRLAVPIHNGVISQFAGHDLLAEQPRTRDDSAKENDRDPVSRGRIAEHADVLLLPYLFGETELAELLAWMGVAADAGLIVRTVNHYLERANDHTPPESALTTAVLARLMIGIDIERSWSLFENALGFHSQGGTGGDAIDIGAMAATVDVVQSGYLGVSLGDDVLRLNPRLPPAVDALTTTLRYRGHRLDVRATGTEVIVTARDRSVPNPIQVDIAGGVQELRAGETLRWSHPDTRTGEELDTAVPAAREQIPAR